MNTWGPAGVGKRGLMDHFERPGSRSSTRLCPAGPHSCQEVEQLGSSTISSLGSALGSGNCLTTLSHTKKPVCLKPDSVDFFWLSPSWRMKEKETLMPFLRSKVLHCPRALYSGLKIYLV